MLYHPVTNYPEKPDNLIYYSDPSLSNKKTLDQYLKYKMQGKIDEAIAAIAEDNSLHFSSADLLNKFEIQIKKIQEYLLGKESDYTNPMVHGGSEPPDPEVHFIWIEEI